jgi:hypothetical protein
VTVSAAVVATVVAAAGVFYFVASAGTVVPDRVERPPVAVVFPGESLWGPVVGVDKTTGPLVEAVRSGLSNATDVGVFDTEVGRAVVAVSGTGLGSESRDAVAARIAESVAGVPGEPQRVVVDAGEVSCSVDPVTWTVCVWANEVGSAAVVAVGDGYTVASLVQRVAAGT